MAGSAKDSLVKLIGCNVPQHKLGEAALADTAIVQIGENSPEQVAYKLMRDIAAAEAREMYKHGDHPADRKWVLDTYAECWAVVRNPNGWLKK